MFYIFNYSNSLSILPNVILDYYSLLYLYLKHEKRSNDILHPLEEKWKRWGANSLASKEKFIGQFSGWTIGIIALFMGHENGSPNVAFWFIMQKFF